MAVPNPRATIPRMSVDRRPADPLRSPRRAPSLLVVLLALVLAACNSTNPSPSPSGLPASPGPTSGPSATPAAPSTAPSSTADPAAVYAAIEQQVEGIRGLTATKAVDPKLLDEAELKRRVQASFIKENPSEIIAANQQLLEAFGMLPKDAKLGDLYIEMLGSQVAGFYSPEDDELYVVSKTGALGPVERVTFAHEFTHALQDQHFDLEGLALDTIGQGDRSLARLSLVEGDATAVMTFWTQQQLTPEETVELLKASLDPEQTAILQKMPPILRESLTFPYEAGLQFVLRLHGAGGWHTVDTAFSKPPASTEQVLHPDKYDAGEAPMAVSLPKGLAGRMGAGWKVGLEDTLGEFQLGGWLRGALNRVQPANEAAAGWGGDRVALLQGPTGAWAVALKTAWDTDTDAAEFETAAREALPKLGGPGDVLPGEGGRTRWIVIGSSDATLASVANALGLAG